MTPLEKYMQGLNPTPDATLIYGHEYRLYRDRQYIGIAKWMQDENVGDSFQTRTERDENGFFGVTVWVADYWEPINN